MKTLTIGMTVGFKRLNGTINTGKVREINGDEVIIQCRKGYGTKVGLNKSEIIFL